MTGPDGGRPRNRSLRLAPLAVAAAIVLAFVVGNELGSRGQASLPDQAARVLRDRFYRPVGEASLEQRSIQAMVGSLGDPYTRYLDPAALRQTEAERRGAYTGVGIRLASRGRRLVVADVFPGGPAAKAGIVGGDDLLAVDGRPVARLRDIVGAVTGPAGTTVRLRVRRGSAAPRNVPVVRAQIVAPPVEASLLSAGGVRVGHLQLFQFTPGAGARLRAATARLIAEGARGLVLDLRGDGGGLVSEAVAAASIFLPKGATIATTNGAHEQPSRLRATGGTIARGVPLVVLVDRSTASASEILAGALRDDGRATLLGTRTYGKARIQVTEPLSNGGAIVVTVAAYRTPSGLDITGKGLLPSAIAIDNPHTAADEALGRALAVAAGRAPPVPLGLPPVTG